MTRDVQRSRRASMVLFFGVLLALVVTLPCTAPVQAEPRWLIVPGVGVGRVTLGMRDAGVFATLGRPPAFCVLNPTGEDKDTVTLFYYPSRGLALTLSSSPYGPLTIVAGIHIVAGYSSMLTDETSLGINGRGYRKCSPNGLLTLIVPRSLYITNDGIQPGSAEAEVIARFGRPQVVYPPVPSRPEVSADGTGSVRAHLILLIPYPARIYSYGGITFGIVNSIVVAIGMNQLPHSFEVPAWFPALPNVDTGTAGWPHSPQ